MIHIITQDNRRFYRHALTEMHRQRSVVFIEHMRWQLSAPEGLEIDAFDAEDAIYLIESDHARAPVRASVRLLPTQRPHLLGEVFSDLCAGGAPRGPRIWEASRFCPAPDTPKGAPRRALLAAMIAGIMETGILFGIEQVTFVASAALAPCARDVGWQVAQLGPAQRFGRERLTAWAAEISSEGLRAVRERNRLSGPVIRFDAPLPQAA